MIDYIKYTVDGEAYELIKNDDGTWSKELNAPSVVGRYDLILEVGQDGIKTYIDSKDPRYNFFLDVIEDADAKVDLIKYLPHYSKNSSVYNQLFEVENLELDILHSLIRKVSNDVFIRTASNEKITRLEEFLGFKGLGNLGQRKSYLLTLFQRGKKLNEEVIKEITNTIAGADCIVTFYASNEVDNPHQGYGLLRVQVLSPDNQKDYRYDDIQRALQSMIPAHIKLTVIKYFGTWAEAMDPFASWNDIYNNVEDWQGLKNYIPDVGD